jgi:Flp pilus assembly protein TadG
MRVRHRSRAASAAGAALVELALLLPPLMLILLGTIDFSRVFHIGMALTNAARAGAQFGAVSLGASADIDGMRDIAVNAVNVAGITAAASQLCQCVTDDGLTFSDTSPSANNCTAPAATSCPASGTHRVVTVTVTTSKAFTMFGRFTGLPGALNLTRTATMRVSE